MQLMIKGKMSMVASEPNLLHLCSRESPNKFRINLKKADNSTSLNYSLRRQVFNGASFCNFKPSFSSSSSCRALNLRARARARARASSTDTSSLVETSESADVFFTKTFPIKQTEKVEGKILIRLDSGKDEENWQLTVGCTLPGKWVLHWGVNYINDFGSEWDQPPLEMRPKGSVPIKDYAIETPLTKSSVASEVDIVHEVKIDFNTNSSIAAINFVLKDEETGAWYQHRGRDFKVPLIGCLNNDGNIVGAKKGFGMWSGCIKYLIQ